MPIVSNGAPDELDSPFYLKNEELCNKWNEYVLAKVGELNAIFNAWSFNIKAKVKTNRTWLIDVKKATYSGGDLLLSAKYQNLLEILTFRTIIKNTGCKDFRISRSIFKRRKRKHPFYDQVYNLVSASLKYKQLYDVTYKDFVLTIVFHHRNDWFSMTDKILTFYPK